MDPGLSCLHGQPMHEHLAAHVPCWTLAIPACLDSPGTAAFAAHMPNGPWPFLLAWPAQARAALLLTLQPRHKLIYSRCTCMGLGNAIHLFAWALKRARSLFLFVHMASPDTGRLRCLRVQWILTKPRHRQTRPPICPWHIGGASTAAQAAAADSLPMYLN